MLVSVSILTLLAVTGIAIARIRDLWAAVMFTGIFSFLGASWMLILDAPDVAFTVICGGRDRSGADLWNVGHAALR